MGSLVKAITSSSAIHKVNKGFNNVCNSIGSKFESSAHKDTFQKIINKIEPTGVNNSFPVMTALMLVAVILPRVLTALKRNPDDKEATKDEIKEILFRDIQTIVIILLATNAISAVISGKMSNKTGLPLTDKPFEKVFNTTETGFKGFKEKVSEFAHEPIDKLKKLGKNLLDAINPMGGVNTLTDEQIISKYTGYNSISEIQKLFKQIGEEKGDKTKVFNTVMDALIEQQKAVIKNAQDIQSAGGKTDIKALEDVLKEIENVKADGVEKLLEKNGDALDKFEQSTVGKQLVKFFGDKENKLAQTGTNTNGVLRMAAFVFNILYLGFGLPALNEKRLEKKYLKEGAPTGVKMEKINEPKQTPDNTTNSLEGHKLTVKEVKIFSSFVK